ncbi:MAG: response regulator [Balneolales bacterium]|nr:response regulator [Balneolales bacterium]
MPSDYGAATQNWSITEDSRGIIYVANSGGILEYDGINWSLIETNAPMRAFTTTQEGRIFASGRNSFGYLDSNSRGETTFTDLSHKIHDLGLSTFTGWRLLYYNGEIYIRDTRFLVRFSPETQTAYQYETEYQFTSLYPGTDGLFAIVFKGSDQFLAKVTNTGLTDLKPFETTPLSMQGSQFWKFDEHTGEALWLLQRGYQLFSFQPDTFDFREEIIIGGHNSDTFYNVSRLIYHTAVFDDGSFGFSLINHGFFYVDKNYSIRFNLDNTTGLSGDTVMFSYKDSRGNIWLGTGDGITYIRDPRYPWLIERKDELNGVPYGMNEFNNEFWVFTSDNAIRYDGDLVFIKEENLHQVFKSELVTTPLGTNALAILARNKILYWDGNTFKETTQERAGWGDLTFLHNPGNSSQIVISGNGHVSFTETDWSTTPFPINANFVYEGYSNRLSKLVWGADNALWAVSENSSLFRFTNSDESIDGFFSDKTDINVFTFPIITDEYSDDLFIDMFVIDGDIILHHYPSSSLRRLLPEYYAENQVRLSHTEPYAPNLRFPDGKAVFYTEKTDSSFVFHTRRNTVEASTITLFEDGRVHIDSLSSRHYESYPFLGLYTNDRFRFKHTSRGIFVTDFKHDYHGSPRRHDVSVPSDFLPAIRSIVVGTDSLFYGGAANFEIYNPALDYHNRSISFTYSQPLFPSQDTEILFQTRLAGYEEEWGEWSTRTFREFVGLPHGRYVFEIRSLTPAGISEPVLYPFSISAPLYLSAWAFLFYTLLLIGLIATATSLRTINLRRKQQEMQKKIDEQTEDLLSEKLALEKAQGELKELSEIKDLLFSNISHELRTPLTLIIGNLEELGKNIDRNDSSYKVAKNNAYRMNQLISQILDITRIHDNAVELKEVVVATNALIRKIVYSFESLAKSKKIKFNVSIDDQLPNIFADPDKLEKILMNLISNAIKFTDNDGLIEISAFEEDDSLVFRVEDTGKGIPADDIPKLFDRYFKSANSQSPKDYSEGLGLGLPICKNFVKMMGGTVEVHSTLNEGSTFIVRIPLSDRRFAGEVEASDYEVINAKNLPDSEYDEFIEDPYDDAVPQLSFMAKDMNILVADDNAEMRFYIGRLLKDQGFNIDLAENGLEVLKKLETANKNHYALVVTDVMMPGMDGYELAEQMRKLPHYEHTPVIFVTARADLDEKIKALRLGVNDYVTKPFEADELVIRCLNLVRLSYQRLSEAENTTNEDEEPESVLVSQDNGNGSANRNSNGYNKPATAASTGTEQGKIKEKFNAAEEALEREDLIGELRKLVLERINDPNMTLSDFAYELNISERGLFRKIKQETGLTPNNFIREIRLLHARHLLERKKVSTLRELTFDIGFSQPSYLKKLFIQRFGKDPASYLK